MTGIQQPHYTDAARAYRNRMIPNAPSILAATDPDFAERLENFAFDTVVNSDDMDDRTRFMCILAALMGCQEVSTFKVMSAGALNFGVTATEIKEIVYQGVNYLGLARALPFLRGFNEVLESRGIDLPLESQAVAAPDERLQAGNAVQVDIFGEGIRENWVSGDEKRRTINRWLAENCFGDYYTRTGLTLEQREMVTFCYLAAQGGCEPQLTAHAIGNMNRGNDAEFLYKIAHQCLPYIGYPRTLNALACIDAAAEQLRADGTTTVEK